MPIDFLRPRFTETEQKIFGVEWVLLHVDTLPNFFNALSWANTFLLLPCGFVNDWYFLAVLVQCVRLAAFNSPFALGVDGAICNEYMGMVIFFFTPVMYGIGGGISILGQIVPDVVLDDGFIFCQSQLLGKCYLNFFAVRALSAVSYFSMALKSVSASAYSAGADGGRIVPVTNTRSWRL